MLPPRRVYRLRRGVRELSILYDCFPNVDTSRISGADNILSILYDCFNPFVEVAAVWITDAFNSLRLLPGCSNSLCSPPRGFQFFTIASTAMAPGLGEIKPFLSILYDCFKEIIGEIYEICHMTLSILYDCFSIPSTSIPPIKEPGIFQFFTIASWYRSG